MTHRGWALGVLMLLVASAVSGCLSSDDGKEVDPKTGQDDDGHDAMDGDDGDAMDGGDGDGGSGSDAETPADPVAPVAAFTINLTAITAGDEVLFDANGTTDEDTDVADLTFAWDFGDGATGNGINTTHVFAAAGVYNVTLNVTDPDGLFNATTQTVTVASGFTEGVFATLSGAVTLPMPVLGVFELAQGSLVGAGACANSLDCHKRLGSDGATYKLFEIQVPAGAGYVKFNIPDHSSTSPVGLLVFKSTAGTRIAATNSAGASSQAVTNPASFDELTWTALVFLPAGANKSFTITAEALAAPPA